MFFTAPGTSSDCLMQSVVPIGWVVLRDEQQDGDRAPTTLTRVTLIAMLSKYPPIILGARLLILLIESL